MKASFYYLILWALISAASFSSCNSDIFIDNFHDYDHFPSSLDMEGNGDSIEIVFTAANWDILSVYETFITMTRCEISAYDQEGNPIEPGDSSPLLSGLGKVVYQNNEGLFKVTFLKDDPETLKIMAENATNDNRQIYLEVGNEYDNRQIILNIRTSKLYVFDSIVFQTPSVSSVREDHNKITLHNNSSQSFPWIVDAPDEYKELYFTNDTWNSDIYSLLEGTMVEIPAAESEDGELTFSPETVPFKEKNRIPVTTDDQTEITVDAYTDVEINWYTIYKVLDCDYTIYIWNTKTGERIGFGGHLIYKTPDTSGMTVNTYPIPENARNYETQTKPD